MAIVYEYRCNSCGATTLDERPEKGTADLNGQPCPVGSCGGLLRRVWSASVVWPMQQRGH